MASDMKALLAVLEQLRSAAEQYGIPLEQASHEFTQLTIRGLTAEQALTKCKQQWKEQAKAAQPSAETAREEASDGR